MNQNLAMAHEVAANRKLLIVGSGFIAAGLARTARNQWRWPVEMLYRNFRNPDIADIAMHRLPASISALTDMIAAIAPSDIVVALGSSFVPDINRDLKQAMQQHLDGPLMVMDAVSRLPAPLAGKILMIGSASEYGQFSDQPVTENHPTNPRDHYGHIKLTLRELGLYFQRMHGLPILHVRQFNVTGAEQDVRFVLPSICRQIATAKNSGGEDFSIVAGNTAVSRDFLSIDDVCAAYLALMLQGQPGEVYNVCSGTAYKISELISIAAELAGARIKVEVSEQLLRENDKVQSIICGNPDRLKSLGWAPQTSMRVLLARMIAKYQAAA